MKRCGRAISASRLVRNQELQELTKRVDTLSAEVRQLAGTTEVLSEIVKAKLVNDPLTGAREKAARRDSDVVHRVEHALKSLVGLPLTDIKGFPHITAIKRSLPRKKFTGNCR